MFTHQALPLQKSGNRTIRPQAITKSARRHAQRVQVLVWNAVPRGRLCLGEYLVTSGKVMPILLKMKEWEQPEILHLNALWMCPNISLEAEGEKPVSQDVSQGWVLLSLSPPPLPQEVPKPVLLLASDGHHPMSSTPHKIFSVCSPPVLQIIRQFFGKVLSSDKCHKPSRVHRLELNTKLKKNVLQPHL